MMKTISLAVISLLCGCSPHAPATTDVQPGQVWMYNTDAKDRVLYLYFVVDREAGEIQFDEVAIFPDAILTNRSASSIDMFLRDAKQIR